MSTAIVIDDSISTNSFLDYRAGYLFEAEIAIGEAYLLRHPDADIIGLNAGVVSGFDNLRPLASTPQKHFVQAVLDYDEVVLIMDSPLQFNGTARPNAAHFLSNELNSGTELQIILVGEVDSMADGLSAVRDDASRQNPAKMGNVLPPYVTMIVDPRTILDFGF